jgi:hypothetical protein
VALALALAMPRVAVIVAVAGSGTWIGAVYFPSMIEPPPCTLHVTLSEGVAVKSFVRHVATSAMVGAIENAAPLDELLLLEDVVVDVVPVALSHPADHPKRRLADAPIKIALRMHLAPKRRFLRG